MRKYYRSTLIISGISEDDIRILELTLSKYLKYRIDQLNESGNEQLLKECIELTGNESLNDTEAAGVILKQLWKRLRETHRLRVVS
jgi:hypothetical protein